MGGDIFTLAGKLIPSNDLTSGRVCSRSAESMQASLCSRSTADFIRQAQYITETMRSALPLCSAKNLPMPEIRGTEYLKNLPDEEPQFSNVEVLPLGHYALRLYLAERAIPFEVAGRYCKEVHYDLRNKRYFAIGFPNDKGGYEVRNKFLDEPSGKPITSRGAWQSPCFASLLAIVIWIFRLLIRSMSRLCQSL